MKYIEYVNQLIRNEVKLAGRIVLFGQNINAGSCLSGLTKNLKVKSGLIINTPNCENTLCGVGFGLMINGVPSIYFMKQQDFLLLGVDHLVNTYNLLRTKNVRGSFTIVSIIYDCGYGGGQSALNNFADFCSIARIPGYTITNAVDARTIINKHLISPGFRIIGVSQRLFNDELIQSVKGTPNRDGSLFQYTKGKDLTIVCFNFSFPYGWELSQKLVPKRLQASLFSVNTLTPINWDQIMINLKRTKKLVLIDDSKSANTACDNFLATALDNCQIKKKLILKRKFSQLWFKPQADNLKVNYSQVINKIIT
ncbi:hypothetical protein A2160_02675 [Candidatus Beckwithbacteria bacterium RBG_13_42_9]|uniref:Transketolase-like pyrimidine-binding domain-containing protein n=1 Tax=Candidatus Beckwithbacteria bacterium RBG_13_42_9 TaxID=1797457 RepID=A0A1F5E7Y7_9BACT|nr:MAG: hypothetical protein A2160_02675 [Candidatus Beckwithbacteria bacterium RBG_13_42_9]